MKPLYDELRFLRALCKSVKKGDFKPSLGIKVRDERRQREQSRQRVRTSQCKPPESQQKRQQRIKTGEDSLDQMRRVLGMLRPARQDDSSGNS